MNVLFIAFWMEFMKLIQSMKKLINNQTFPYLKRNFKI